MKRVFKAGPTRKNKRCLQKAVLSLSLVALAASWAAASDDQELLDFVLTQTAQAAKRISSLSYNFRYEIDYEPDRYGQRRRPAHVVGSGQVLQQGVKRSTSWDMVRTWSDRPDQEQIENRTVINDDYFAFWHVGNKFAYEYDHESPASMHRRAKEFQKVSARDHMAYAFGPYCNLKERYLDTVGRYQWKAESQTQPDSTVLFYVHMITPWMQKTDQPEVTYVIDPQKGFLITRRFDYHTDGRLKTDVKVSVEEFQVNGEGMCLPVRIEEKKFQPRNGGSDQPKLRSSFKAELSDFNVNQPFDDEKFTVEALGLTNDIVLIQQTIAGQLISLIYRDGVFIPEDMVRGTELAIDFALDDPLPNPDIEPRQETRASQPKLLGEPREVEANVTTAAKAQPQPAKTDTTVATLSNLLWLAVSVLGLLALGISVTFLVIRAKQKGGTI